MNWKFLWVLLICVICCGLLNLLFWHDLATDIDDSSFCWLLTPNVFAQTCYL